MSLSKAAVNRAHILVITARSHAAEAERSVEEHKDWQEAVAHFDTRSQATRLDRGRAGRE
jgi:hypothetical protein